MRDSSLFLESLDEIPGDLKKQVIQELKHGYQMELVQSAMTQKRIGYTNHTLERKSIDGVGRLRMSVDPTHFHYWGQKLGYDCWKDNNFLNDVEKYNPELRIKCGGTKLQVGYSGGSKRSSTTYNL